jgi:hypothetical protein
MTLDQGSALSTSIRIRERIETMSVGQTQDRFRGWDISRRIDLWQR